MRHVLVIFTFLCALRFTARADDFLKSSPGELSKSHESIDTKDQCATCHEPDNSVTANKCLGCHEHADLKKKIDNGEGFHVSASVKGRACKLCHQEHKGRSFDLMGWAAINGPKNFDHKLTGWALEGKHSGVVCATCHTTTNKAQGLRTYIGTDKTCGTCHNKDSKHGALRKANQECGHCHGVSTWTPPKAKLDFNHDDKAQAAMPLEGSHADVACAKCHVKSAFKLPQYDGGCELCHKSPHQGQLFGTKKCQLCHSPALRKLKDIHFDHKKETGYPLLAKHANLGCETCHTKGLGTKKPTGACEFCHQKDSKHGNRFEKFPACATCHSQRAWKGNFQFNHLDNTGFDLTGKHAKVDCRACHRGKNPADYERFEIKNGCMSCHQHKKAHGGKYKNNECLTCHEEAGSKKIRRETALETYHGETSKFPLRGAHASVQCQMCHINDVYKETPRECGVSCHEDSLHKGSLGQECSRCHEPGKWPAVRFDHTEDTKWPLKGKHAGVKNCESCHANRVYSKTPTSCSDGKCHKKDDVHQGKLGTTCEKCHEETGKILFQHNRDAQFKIDGAHQPLVCASCHKNVQFKPIRKDCYGCHPEPAIHKGMYGTLCDSCHSTKTFGDLKALHDVGDFSLTGAHDQVDCAKCHPHGEKLRGSGNLCISCHRKDDIHKNSLSPRCGECHTQRSFAPARFDHITVGCNLMGLHATLPCADCHKNGNYGALSPTCVSCHRYEALRVKTPDHRGYTFECGTCHSPNAWNAPTQIGIQTICR